MTILPNGECTLKFSQLQKIDLPAGDLRVMVLPVFASVHGHVRATSGCLNERRFEVLSACGPNQCLPRKKMESDPAGRGREVGVVVWVASPGVFVDLRPGVHSSLTFAITLGWK